MPWRLVAALLAVLMRVQVARPPLGPVPAEPQQLRILCRGAAAAGPAQGAQSQLVIALCASAVGHLLSLRLLESSTGWSSQCRSGELTKFLVALRMAH